MKPPSFLTDHERTGLMGRRRRALCNLVLVETFDFPDLSATDRIKTLASYATILVLFTLIYHMNAILKQRIRRDTNRKRRAWP